MDGMAAAVRGVPNWEAVGPDYVPAELPRTVTTPNPSGIFPTYLFANVWGTGDVPQQWNYVTIEVFRK